MQLMRGAGGLQPSLDPANWLPGESGEHYVVWQRASGRFHGAASVASEEPDRTFCIPGGSVEHPSACSGEEQRGTEVLSCSGASTTLRQPRLLRTGDGAVTLCGWSGAGPGAHTGFRVASLVLFYW